MPEDVVAADRVDLDIKPQVVSEVDPWDDATDAECDTCHTVKPVRVLSDPFYDADVPDRPSRAYCRVCYETRKGQR